MAKTILLIEDDKNLIEIYTISLEKVNLKVEVIEFGQDVLKWIEKVRKGEAKKPDLILLDLILPDMNGLDVLKEIRKVKKIKDLPVFILTNYSGRQLRQLGFDLKSEQYLEKINVLPSRLVALVKERLKEKNM